MVNSEHYVKNGRTDSSNPRGFVLDLKKQAFVSIFPQIVTTLAITKAKDQIRPELKRLDPEIMLELTDIRFQNDYSTLVLCASGNDALSGALHDGHH